MAQIVFTDCHLMIDGVDYSGQGTSIAIAYTGEAPENTPFGSTTKTRLEGGVKDWSLEAELNADGADPFFDLVSTSVAVAVRASSAAVSSENPEYSGNAILVSHAPISGAHGEAHTWALSFSANGDLTMDEGV